MKLRWLFALISSGLLACGDDGHEDAAAVECPSEAPAIEKVTASATTVAPGGTITLTFDVAGFELDEATVSDAMLPLHGEEDAEEECPGGHMHVYLDSLETDPIMATDKAVVDVTIPVGTTEGEHELIVRVHNHDHAIYEPQVTKTVSISVQP